MDSIRINSRLWKFKETEEVEKSLTSWAFQAKSFPLIAKHREKGVNGIDKHGKMY